VTSMIKIGLIDRILPTARVAAQGARRSLPRDA
jgi:hypothetical protein